MKISKLLMTCTALILAVSCSHHRGEVEKAKARLLNQDGEEVGVVNIKKDGEDIELVGAFSGLRKDAKQGFHVHQVGDCSGDFKSAKGHFNPDGHRHGSPGSDSHAGDFGNLLTDGDGTAEFNYQTSQLTLDDSKNSIIGKSLIIHSGSDDMKSQPSGDAGARYACGVVTAIR